MGNLNVGVHEYENVPLRVRHAQIPRSGGAQSMRGSNAASPTPLGDLPGTVGRAIVNDDDFKVRAIGEAQRVQASRKVHGPVVHRYDYTQFWQRDMLIRVKPWTDCFRHVFKASFSCRSRHPLDSQPFRIGNLATSGERRLVLPL